MMSDQTELPRFWWVNQNQTFEQETGGGYMWSPKRRSNQTRNPFYEFMREVAPGDIVFSFQGTFIRALGVVQSHAYECPKPPEFGGAGPNWDKVGWKVDLRYFRLATQVRPADHMRVLERVLPPKYSPLRTNGYGKQSVYLTKVPNDLAAVLIGLIGREAKDIVEANRVTDYVMREQPAAAGEGQVQWEEHLAEAIWLDRAIQETTKRELILARRGQGLFKKRVRRIESRCRITGVDRIEHLRASHCKPWRDCSNEERLEGENGLLLTPSIDHLFDRGFISFENSGGVLISPAAHKASLERMGMRIDGTTNVGAFSEGQKHFLEYHRDSVFLMART